jgi:C1A family cysteine protease
MSQDVYTQEWNKFITDYDKTYDTPEEYTNAYNAFRDNLDYIRLFNTFNNNMNDMSSVKLDVNEFADINPLKFKHKSSGLLSGRGHCSPKFVFAAHMSNTSSVPDSVDWVEKGGVTPVKNQGQCGSCWAFSTTGAIEGAIFAKHGKLENLSEQELVDCGKNTGNEGCNGGLMDDAFKYVEKNGLAFENDYPYEGKDDSCRINKVNNTAPYTHLTGFVNVHSMDEVALKAAVAQQPVSIAIEADQIMFQFYRSGVFSHCGNKNLDHGVLIVGYGTSEDGVPYWKVKNSWGKSWGSDGYILLKRNEEAGHLGTCGLAIQPSYPIVV